MSSTNFIIANIKLCIEISDDGNYKIHENRTHMDFHPCDDLPPIRKNEDGENIMQNILQMVSSSTNKIKWDNDNDFVGGDHEDNVSEYTEEEDDQDDDDEEDDDESKEEDEEDQGNEEEDESKEDESKEETNDKKEEEPRVYNHEINTEPKKTSLTTTLKNRVKNNISKKNRGI